jgi:hypothetical protein
MKKAFLLLMTLLAMAGMNMAQDIYSMGYYNIGETGLTVPALYKNGSMIQAFTTEQWYGEGTDVLVAQNGKVYCAYNVREVVENNYGPWCAYVYNTDGTYLLDAGYGTRIYAICEGNDGTIYSFGNVKFGEGGNAVWRAAYWVNGSTTPVYLSDILNRDSYAKDGCVDEEGNVYAVGYQYTDNFYEHFYGKVWRNGAEWQSFGSQTTAESVAIYEGDVYTAGQYDEAGETSAMVWKNSSVHYTLPHEGTESYANSICIYDGDIYVAGMDEDGYGEGKDGNPISRLTVWKNGTVHYSIACSDDEGDRSMNAVVATSSGVYSAGSRYGQGKIWKDGVVHYSPESCFCINAICYGELGYTITAMANPTEGGTISGTGIYVENETCTLTATPYPGYGFVNWTEDGMVVSTDATYNFTVTSNRYLVANFGLRRNIFATANPEAGGEIASSGGITEQIGELTVHDGTTTSNQVPFYGLWVDDFTRNEMIYPAAELRFMNGGDINSLTFYKNETNTNSWGTASFQIYLKEVSNTTLNEYTGMTEATVVYEGSVDAEGGERQVTINFTTPYHYNGGNLLVGVYQTIAGSWSSAYWYGEEVAGASASGSSVLSAAYAYFNQCNFLPKTTFSFTGGVGISITYYIEGSSCTFTATPNEGYRFVNWKKDNGLTLSNNAAYSFTVTEDIDLVATFEPPEQVYIGDGGTQTSSYLPIHTKWYGHTLSQQIYTVEEIGSAGYLNSIAFYNTGNQQTRSLDLYLTHTDKANFEDNYDWIIPAGADRVFSGSVTLLHNNWTWIVFDTPFPYNGTSNLALIVDDNTGSHSSSSEVECLTLDALGQSIYWVSNNNFDPFNPPIGGIRPDVKNQIKLGRDLVPDPATITARAYPEMYGTVAGAGVFTIGSPCTLTATPTGSLDFLYWMKDGEVVSTNATYTFNVTENADFVAQFGAVQADVTIGGGTATGMYLPTTSTLNYSLTQQIYTANEIGRAGIIGNVAFQNGSNGATCTRNLDLYLVPTDKTAFASATDWVAVTEADRVFSGSVTLTAGAWTPITLDTPFDYDGTSNLVLVVDDNTGSTTGNIMYCSHFSTQGQQALYINGGDNYDPTTANYTGSLLTVKNQIKLGGWPPNLPYLITVATEPGNWGSVSGLPASSYQLYGTSCTLTATANEGYAFISWTRDGIEVSTDPTYSFTVTGDTDIVAYFEVRQEVTVGSDPSIFHLPSYLSYNYSLSQQIYTPDEIGGTSGYINGIAFYHCEDADTRTWDIYMQPTDKAAFGEGDGWEAVTEADRVFSGTVTLTAYDWTWITFDTPFFYDGTSNILLTVDDNSGNQGSQHGFAVFNTDATQTLYYANNTTNFDPTAPAGYTALYKSSKNQIKLDRTFGEYRTVSAYDYPMGWYYDFNEVYGVGATCTLTAPNLEVYGLVFVNWATYDETIGGCTNVATNSTYSFTVTENIELVAVYGTPQDIYIGNGHLESTDDYLPALTNYSYSLTEQIYTADEIGAAGTITGITFFKNSQMPSMTSREWNIYLVPTDKAAFGSQTDWIAATNAYRVFSGTVTTADVTTTIDFDTPFVYDGTSNLVLVVEDHSGWSGFSLSHRVFDANGNQTLYASRNTEAFNPQYAGAITGTLLSEKNQITLKKASYQSYCTISAEANPYGCGTALDSYGWDWNDYFSGTSCTLMATPAEGFDFVCWTKDGEVVSYNATYTFTVTEDATYVANFGLTHDTYIGDYGTSTSNTLPTTASHKYFITEQIYTADELGGAETFTHIAFYNNETATRTFDIYLVPTDKAAFENGHDWMTVTEADLVFSGEVTLAAGEWSWIAFDTPFAYDGVSNLALIVDDNTGSVQGSIYCRKFNTTTTQTLHRTYGSSHDISPINYGGNGTLESYKNQIKLRRAGIAEPLTITATVDPEEGGQVNGDSYYSETFYSNHKDLNNITYTTVYDFENGALQGWTTIDADGDGYTWYNISQDGWLSHSGTGVATSASYSSYVGPLTPDNWLVSPQMTLSDVMSFWACGQLSSWPSEHFAVYVSTSGNSISDFIQVLPETVATATMTQYTVNLGAYVGQTGYVAIRHFNVTDMYYLNVDDISFGEYAGIETPTCTLTATPNSGFDFIGWTKDGVAVSTDNPYTFPVTDSADFVAHFGQSQEVVIGGGTATSTYLPTHASNYYYLSEQIYTADEIGGSGIISSLSFYNDNNYDNTSSLRVLDIYLAHTDKTVFEYGYDWIQVTEADRVFRGSVDFLLHQWTEIVFNTPFFYDGTSNLVLVVDDNTGHSTELVYGLTFDTEAQQALCVGNNVGTNYDPLTSLIYVGTLYNKKNQIKLNGGFAQMSNITATVNPEVGGTVEGAGIYQNGITCTLEAIPATGYAFSSWIDSNGTVVSVDATYSFTVTEDVALVANFGKKAVSDLYVSRTGWAMWNGDGQDAPDVTGFSYSFSEDFEGGIPAGWTVEGDGYWMVATGDAGGGNALHGNYNMLFDPNSPGDAYLVTPEMDLSSATEGSLNFYFANRGNSSADYNYNYFGVYYRVDGGEWNELYYTEIGHYSYWPMFLPLEGFAANYQIGFKGFYNPNGLGVAVDYVTLNAGVGSGTRDFQDLQLTLSDLDDNVIYTGTTPNNYAQLPTEGLTEGEVYRLTVAQQYASGLSGNTTCTWLYEPCSNFEGVSNLNSEVTDQGVTLTWDTPETTPAEPIESGWYYYDNGYNCESIGTLYSHPLYWGIMIPAGSYAGNAVSKVAAYDRASMTGTVTIYNDGETAPANPVGSREVTFTGANQFVEFEFENPMEIDPSKNVWVVFYTEDASNIPAAVCVNTGDPNGRWISNDGETWRDIDINNGYSYTFMVRAYIMDNSDAPAPVGAPYGVAVFRDGEWLGLAAGHDSFTDPEGTANSHYEVRVVYSGPQRLPYKNAYYAMSCAASTATYEITATANPTAGGSVNGAGTYNYGQTCTLTATANAGYTFTNWTRNNNVVSTSATYTFTITEDADFVANFRQNVCTVTVAANPTAGGTAIQSGNGTYNYGTAITLTATANAGYTFLYWTANDAMLSTNPVCTLTVTGDTYCVARFVLDDATVQVTPFTSGWNWYSTYIEQSGIDGLAQLEESLGANGIQIKSQGQYLNYYEGMGWMGMLSGINNESSYKIKANAPCVINMIGEETTSSAHPITIGPGWNWIGYPVSTAMSIGEAMSGITPYNGDQLKGLNGYAGYYTGMGWMGTLSTITPGMGLLYKSTGSGSQTLVYPTSSKGGALAENVTPENNHWVPDLHAYPDNMTVTAIIELDNEELSSENYELAAFANSECRGSVRLMYVEPLNRHIAFLTIAGEEVTTLTFSLYDAATGEEIHGAQEMLNFSINATVGNVMEPYVIRFRGMMGMDDFDSRISVFPNPVGRGEVLNMAMPTDNTGELCVEIVNALGVVIETLRATTIQAIAAPTVAGVYTLRITIEGKGTYYRKLVVR